MRSTRRTALWAGVLFALTFVASIPAVFLYGGFGPLIDHPRQILGGSDTRVQLGAFLELIVVFANIGTAVVLFPILKWQSEAGAIGYVAARVVESVFIAVGVFSLLVALQFGRDVGAASRSFIALHDWTFVLGPGFVVGIGNGLLLGWMMYRSALVPRRLAIFGLIGGPLILLSGTAVLFGVIDAGGSAQALATIPEIIWEGGLTIYLIVKGFRASPLVDLTEAARERVRLEPMTAPTPAAR
jgi:hypothetical protein